MSEKQDSLSPDTDMTQSRNGKGSAGDIDVHIGQRIKERRLLMGLSQEKLAESAGVSFQQVQKYERGTNRVSADRLKKFSVALNVSLDYFFEEYNASLSGPVPGLGEQGQSTLIPDDVLAQKETRELIRVYYSIPDEKLRQQFMALIKSMAENYKN